MRNDVARISRSNIWLNITPGSSFRSSGLLAPRALPGSARAQASKILRVGIVSVNKRHTPFFITFERRMRELGYDEENLAIEFLNVPSPAEYPKVYQELVERHVNIIVGLLELLKQLGLIDCGDARSGVTDRHME